MRIYVVLALIVFSIPGFAQNEQAINLLNWEGKTVSVPFRFGPSKDTRSQTRTIGVAHDKRKNKDVNFVFEDNSEEMFSNFLKKYVDEGSENSITIHVNRLEIIRRGEDQKWLDKIYFSFTFHQTDGDIQLYKYEASNTVTSSKNPRLDITNYISRALNSAVSNFKSAYLKHPEWKKLEVNNLNSPSAKMSTKIIYNQFASTGDTIALDKNYKLQLNDFTAPVLEDEEGDAFSHFTFTYKLSVDDRGKEVLLTVKPQAYFLRSKSWAKNAAQGSTWRSYQQLLFDLSTLHAYRFKEKLSKTQFSPGFYKSEINQIYNEVNKAYFNEMDLLQEQTKFGANSSLCDEWKVKIETALAAFP